MTLRHEFGRRPKSDDFNDLDDLSEQEEDFEGYEEDGEGDEKDEEVDFDKPTFSRDQIWTDYAEDLDFDD